VLISNFRRLGQFGVSFVKIKQSFCLSESIPVEKRKQLTTNSKVMRYHVCVDLWQYVFLLLMITPPVLNFTPSAE